MKGLKNFFEEEFRNQDDTQEEVKNAGCGDQLSKKQWCWMESEKTWEDTEENSEDSESKSLWE